MWTGSFLARCERGACAAPADARRGMADRAVSLGVTAHARVQIALSFPRVVRGCSWWVGPAPSRASRMRIGRVKAAAPGKRRVRTRLGHAGALMATNAERLQPVTARAVRIELASGDFVHVEPVVRMHLSGSHPAIVTLDAVVLGVTARTKLTVGPRYAFCAVRSSPYRGRSCGASVAVAARRSRSGFSST